MVYVIFMFSKIIGYTDLEENFCVEIFGIIEMVM